MLVTALLFAFCTTTSAAWRVDAPVVLTAQAPASAQDTSLVPWVGPRVGLVDNEGGGAFSGFEGALLVGVDSQGTNEVSVLRVPVLVEGRGVYGGRLQAGLVGVGGYGFVSAGVGGGLSFLQVYDDGRTGAFGLWLARGGGGVEFSFLQALTRIELGAGVRDLRPELSGSFSVGARF